MLFDLVGSKIMTVYVAEIKGRGIAAFHADNGSDADRREVPAQCHGAGKGTGFHYKRLK
jgi:hypothetical protein